MTAREAAVAAAATVIDRMLNEPGLSDAERIALSHDALKASAAVRAIDDTDENADEVTP